MNKFQGWKNVFAFTYKQNTGTKTYRLVTGLVAVLVLALALLITVISIAPDEEEETKPEFSNIHKVLVADGAEVGEIPYTELGALAENATYYERVAWESAEQVTTEEELARLAKEKGGGTIGLLYTMTEEGLSIRAVIPETSGVGISEGEKLANRVAIIVQSLRYQNSGLSMEQLMAVETPVAVTVGVAGEETNVVAYLIKLFAPAVFGIILYMLLLMYGQRICQQVSTEKTSKLMETLLTSLHPYALLTGKVFAIVATALTQFFLWIALLVIGVIGGVAIGRSMYPESTATVTMVVDFLRENIGESALSPAAVVLAILIFCCGFLFYCVIAGLAGSMVTRPEEASSVQGVFTLPIVISWIVCYMGSLLEKENILAVARNIPFTIPFGVPVELLTGTVGILQGVISLVILLVFSLLCILLSARIYKGMVLYTGQKLSLKNIVGIIRNK
jgi:ABC-type Na+ efflux pump permease subunit